MAFTATWRGNRWSCKRCGCRGGHVSSNFVLVGAALLFQLSTLAFAASVGLYLAARRRPHAEELEERIVELFAELAMALEENVIIRDSLNAYRTVNYQLLRAVEELKNGRGEGVLDWDPGSSLYALADSDYKLQMFDGLSQAFSFEEVKQIAWEIGIDPENIDGKTKPTFVRNLVDQAGREDKRDELTRTARKKRPSRLWPTWAPDRPLTQ